MTELPRGWVSGPLAEICHIEMGQSPPSSTYNTDGVGLPFLQGKREFGTLYPTPAKYCSSPSKVARAGAVLLSVRAPVGPTNITVDQCCIGRGLAAISPFPGISTRFVLWALRKHESTLAKAGAGSTFAAVSKAQVASIPIACPPLNEQLRIVARIDTLFGEIDRGVQSLRDAKRLIGLYRQSLLNSAFEGRLTVDWRARNAVCNHWSWVSLSTLGEVAGGLTKNQKRNGLRLKAKYLRVANVYSNRLKLDEVKEMGVTKEELRKTRLAAGDLLFVEGNGSIEQIGRVAVWNGSVPDVTHQNHVIRFRADGSLSPRFALYFMMSPVGRRRITAQASSTSGLHTLSISKVAALSVPLCSLEEQVELVRILDSRFGAAEAMEGEIDANLARAEALRQSILKRAFSGKLVPQDPDDEPAQVLLDRIRAHRERDSTTKPRKPVRRRARPAQPP